jgi:MraZ protein
METNPSRYRPLFLTTEYDAILDDKNRILIPADFRKEILEARNEKTLICRIGRNKIASLYPSGYYEEMINQRRATLLPGADEDRFNQVHYGMISRLTWDAQGRVVVPERVLQRTNMQKNLTLVGSRDHIQIWNKVDWDRQCEALLDSIDESFGTATPPAATGTPPGTTVAAQETIRDGPATA